MEKGTEEQYDKIEMEVDKKVKDGAERGFVRYPQDSAKITRKSKPYKKTKTIRLNRSKKLVIGSKKTKKKNLLSTLKRIRLKRKRIGEKEKKKEIEKPRHSLKQPYIISDIIGMTMVLLGIVFLFYPSYLNLKISFTMILIGCILVFLISGESRSKETHFAKINENIVPLEKARKLMSEKISLIMIIWILFLFLVTGDADLEIFFVLIFIGMLVVKELTNEFITSHLKRRMNGFIVVFLITYIAIITQKILTF